MADANIPEGPPSDSPQERLAGLARRGLQTVGLELVHLDYRKEGRRWLLRLYIDRAGGVTLDDCTRASDQVSALLDADDLIPHRYTLEVSSPGLDRPLFTEEDYRRFTGRRARLTTHRPVEGRRRRLLVTLLGCEDGTVGIRLEDGQNRTIPFGLIASGRLEVELEAVES